MILALILANALLWDAPTTNCDGTPLTDLDHYEVMMFRARVVGMTPCSDGSEDLCPVYARDFPFVVTTDTRIDLPTGLGEVTGWLDPIAVDKAGNTSEGCIPP